MTGKEIEVAFLRAAMGVGLTVSTDRIRDDGSHGDFVWVEVDHGVALEWTNLQGLPFGLFQHVPSDEQDGFAGDEQELGRFLHLEEMLEAAFIRIIRIRLENVTSEKLLA